MTLNMAVEAPMPRARVIAAIIANEGDVRRLRKAKRMSRLSVSTCNLPYVPATHPRTLSSRVLHMLGPSARENKRNPSAKRRFKFDEVRQEFVCFDKFCLARHKRRAARNRCPT